MIWFQHRINNKPRKLLSPLGAQPRPWEWARAMVAGRPVAHLDLHRAEVRPHRHLLLEEEAAAAAAADCQIPRARA